MKLIFKNVDVEFQKDATLIADWYNTGYINNNGGLTENSHGWNTGLIDISIFDSLQYAGNISDGGYQVAFFDDTTDMSHLSEHLISSVSILGVSHVVEATISLSSAKAAGAKYAIVSLYSLGDLPSLPSDALAKFMPASV